MLPLLLASSARGDSCASYADPERITVDATPVDESSGLAASRTRPGVFFTHDDAGGDAVLYAVDLQGGALGTHLVRGAALVDWEDLSPGPCPKDGAPCLYVGDIGDNDGVRPYVTIYVVPEPAEGEDAKVVEAWDATYPDGPRDAETLLVHPCTGDVHVVSKTSDGTGTVYRLPADRRGELVLQRVADLVLDDERAITGGQWDADGDRLVIRTRERLWEWRTDPADPDGHWDEPPVEVAAVDEVQGEGVAFATDGSLVTSDEGHPLSLHRMRCEDPSPGEARCAFVPVGGCGCDGGGAAGAVPLAALALLRRRRTPLEAP